MNDIPALSVSIQPSALATMEEHCFSRVDVEVGGFLLGHIAGSSTTVLEARPALAANSAQTHLTITHEAWNEVLSALDTEYAGLTIVGWYHTHPGFGLFLSDYDIFIQANFFNSPGQFALVLDPLIGEYAMFVAEGETAKRFEGGPTVRSAISVESEDIGAARALMLTEASGTIARAGRSWKSTLVAVIATSVLVGSGAWYLGMIQGQDAAAGAGSLELSGLNDRIADLQARLDEAMEAAAQQASAAPEAESSAAPTETAPLIGPQVGDPVRVTISHVVRPGESWWSISQRYLGAGRRYPEIQAENSEYQGLDAGDVIAIPLSGTYLASEGASTS